MQPRPFPLGTVLANPFLFNADLSDDGGGVGGGSSVGFESSRVFFLLPLLLLRGSGGGMDFSKVGEKILSSVRSARSLGLLPSTRPSDRPEVPARAAAAAAVARVLSGLPPHQRFSLTSSSQELRSMYGSRPDGQVVEELEEDFYQEDFDPVRHILEHIPSEENELEFFEKQAALRLAQLDKVGECLSQHVMQHHEVMVKGMNLVRELEKDLRVSNVICMNGRRHLASSMNEVSRDLIVNSYAKKKQALVDMLPILTELHRVVDLQASLESLVEEGNYCKAFQVLSEYLQLLDSFSEFSAIQEMSRGVEVWLGRTLQRIDSLLLGVCQEFKEEAYITVVDAYALIGDISGFVEKIQSFFMQEVLSESHSVLKNILQEDQGVPLQNSRLTYSDLCLQIPESKFRQCLLRTLAILFRLMCSYHEIMAFQLENKDLAYQASNVRKESDNSCQSAEIQQLDSKAKVNIHSEENKSSLSQSVAMPSLSTTERSSATTSLDDPLQTAGFMHADAHHQVDEVRTDDNEVSSSGSPWYVLRKDATAFVSQALQRGRKNLWQLSTSRVSVLLSSAVVGSMSIHQFLKDYEDLNVFILAGEAFCGVEAVEFRQKLKIVCENYFAAFHRQSISAVKMVLEKENWQKLPPDAAQAISFPGLVGDGASLLGKSDRLSNPSRLLNLVDMMAKESGFTSWLKSGNPFSPKQAPTSKGHNSSLLNGEISAEYDGDFSGNHGDNVSSRNNDGSDVNGDNVLEDENEDLLADFIDEDSQLPSRITKLSGTKIYSSQLKNDDTTAQTGSSVCLLRLMDKYARLMQKLEIVNVEFFKGICQLFAIFFYFVFETFGHESSNPSGKNSSNSLNYRLKTALSRVTQDCDQWIKPQLAPNSASPTSLSTYADLTPSPTSHSSATSFGLKERCAAADTVSLVARILHRSKAHLQSMLLQSNPTIVEDFFVHLVDSVPDLTVHIHRTTARILLHINGYVDRITNAKWEVKELGLEHNGYVDLLLGEFKHYKTRLAHGGIHKEVQDLLLEYGLEIVAETLIEGLSRVKRCTDEGRGLMLLDLQVLFPTVMRFACFNFSIFLS
uniref:Uncharacterized protein MANES_11G154000 n=1 Tax=Rhizophora mucronata TaxID=61149 RepID=A0A2P2L7N4_RHIMU